MNFLDDLWKYELYYSPVLPLPYEYPPLARCNHSPNFSVDIHVIGGLTVFQPLTTL